MSGGGYEVGQGGLCCLMANGGKGFSIKRRMGS